MLLMTDRTDYVFVVKLNTVQLDQMYMGKEKQMERVNRILFTM
jgi:hypothetical protein